MAVSDIGGYRQRANFWKRLLGQLSRYDLLLAAIPLTLALALLWYLFTPVPLHVAIATGSILGCVFVVDALYFHAPAHDEPAEPVSTTSESTTSSASPPASD